MRYLRNLSFVVLCVVWLTLDVVNPRANPGDCVYFDGIPWVDEYHCCYQFEQAALNVCNYYKNDGSGYCSGLGECESFCMAPSDEDVPEGDCTDYWQQPNLEWAVQGWCRCLLCNK